jgi:hypothetical protein
MAGAASMLEPIAPIPADRTNFLRSILSILSLWWRYQSIML